MNKGILIIVLLYIVVLACIGVYFNKRNRNNKDFYVTRDRIPGWAIAISESATTSSSWMMLGGTGAVYTMGVSGIWLFFGLYLSLIIYWFWFAKAFKKENDKDPQLTLTSFIAARWGSHEKVIRLLCALIIAGFYIIYAASNLVGAGKTVNSLFGYDTVPTMIVVAVIITAYAALGGLGSIIYNDLIQAVIMCFALVVLPVIAWIHVFQSGGIVENLQAAGPDYMALFGGMTTGSAFLLVFNQSSYVWGNFGMDTVTRKIMAIKKDEDIKSGRIAGLITGFVWYFGVFSIGITGLCLYGSGTFSDPETLFPTMVDDLLPGGLSVLVLCGVIAAIMSTCADQLLAVTGAISVDIVQKVFKVQMKERTALIFSKILLAGVGVATFLFALNSGELVMNMVSFAWSGMGSSLGPVVLLTMLDKKASGIGMIATLIAGAGATLVWGNIAFVSAVDVKFGAFFLALLVGIIVSRIVPNKKMQSEQEKTDDQTEI